MSKLLQQILVLIIILCLGIVIIPIYIACPRKELLHGRVECITNEQIPESACVTMLYRLPNDIDIFVWKTKQSYTGFLTAGLFRVFPRLFNNV